MEYRQPHEIANRLLEARMALRAHVALEAAIIKRVGALPEDDFCRLDIEYLQLGAGYAHMIHENQAPLDPSPYGTEYTAAVLEGFFAIRPRNRYLYEHEVQEHRKHIYEAVLTPDIELPDHIDPYEVSAAAMFIEGFALVTAYHGSHAEAQVFDTTGV